MSKKEALLSDLKKALERLVEAVNLPYSLVVQNASIQRFEFCFEFSWKLMQSILTENGIEAYGPKNAIREAAKLGLINNLESWLEFLKARNLTTHTYEDKIAKEVYEKSKSFFRVAEKLIKNTEKQSASS